MGARSDDVVCWKGDNDWNGASGQTGSRAIGNQTDHRCEDWTEKEDRSREN
jgi:hypothetical protein